MYLFGEYMHYWQYIFLSHIDSNNIFRFFNGGILFFFSVNICYNIFIGNEYIIKE